MQVSRPSDEETVKYVGASFIQQFCRLLLNASSRLTFEMEATHRIVLYLSSFCFFFPFSLFSLLIIHNSFREEASAFQTDDPVFCERSSGDIRVTMTYFFLFLTRYRQKVIEQFPVCFMIPHPTNARLRISVNYTASPPCSLVDITLRFNIIRLITSWLHTRSHRRDYLLINI